MGYTYFMTVKGGHLTAEAKAKISATKRERGTPSPMEGRRHTEESRNQISATKRAASGRSMAPLVPQLCACGCGEYAAVDERRNRVSKYVTGHNSRSAHPMKGKHHTEEAKRVIAEKALQQMDRQFPDRTPKRLRGTGAHNSWHWMMSRCFDSWNASYPRYGGRGITVCERWLTFENFYADMGDRPEGLTLERKDSNGNYEPGNCVWATMEEQNDNRSNPWETRRAKYGPSGRRAKEVAGPAKGLDDVPDNAGYAPDARERVEALPDSRLALSLE